MTQHARFLSWSLIVGFCLVAPAQGQLFQPQVAGVEIDAEGVLRTRTVADPTGQLARQRIAESRMALSENVARPSSLRKISLRRLEAAIEDQLARHAPLDNDLRYLAGMTRIEYVFVYPEEGDVVIAGPAEGYMLDLASRPVGISSGRAVLELQDLITALRAFPAQSDQPTTISCSIDPTQEGLQRMRQYIATVSGHVTPGDAERYAAGLRESLGMQAVSISGISPKSHFAQVLVEADYRMKLIGIGLEKPPVRIQTFIEKASPTDVARNALQRWYFVPNYDSVRVSEDLLAMQVVGQGVKLESEDEHVLADGRRQQSRRVDHASQVFTQSFTKQYAKLAEVVPVYAQLRNMIDLAIVAAFLREYDAYGRSGWMATLFQDPNRLDVNTYPVPKRVESAVNVVWKGNTLMTPIGGGVNIQADQAFSEDRLAYDETGQMDVRRRELTIPQDDPKAWWWD